MTGGTISQHLRRAARQYPLQCAIVDGDQRISYAQLLERTGAIRGWIESALRPGQGDIIAVCLANSWQFVACFLAVSELGCIFLPCNPNWRASEWNDLQQRLRILGVIAEAHMVEAIPLPALSIDEAPRAQEGDGAPPRASSPDAPVAYVLTSGSTGAPRVVPRTHRNLIAGSRSVVEAMGIRPGWRFLGASPFYHAMGFNNAMLAPLLAGATVVLLGKFNPAECAQLINRERTDVLLASPLIFSLLADSDFDPRWLSTLRLCFAGAARMPDGLPQRWLGRFGLRLRPWYGMSEAHVISFDMAPQEPPPQPGDYVGRPIPGVEIRSLAPDGSELRPTEVGELAVRSGGVTPGYIDDPEWNQRVFADGFFRTGDLGYLDPAGNLYLTGRVRRVINIGGIKVDPFEIEQTVQTLAGVVSCQVDAASHERTGEMIRARILLRPGAGISRRDVIEHCRRRLAEYKLPRIIELMEASAVPLTGKWPSARAGDESSPKT